MIVKLTVESNSIYKNDTGSRIFNTDYIVEARTVETSKTEFLYQANPRDRRSKTQRIRVTDGIATIKTAFAATWQTNYIDLPIFPNNDSTETAVANTCAKESFCYAVPDASASTSRSYVHVLEGAFKIKKVLVDYNLDQLIDLADTGATTTTTTTTTTA